MTGYPLRPNPNTTIWFDMNGKEVGKLFLTDAGTLDFEGNATEAAKIFFEAFPALFEGMVEEALKRQKEAK